MGTRHLISIIKDGETKLAQYGQWDGYLDGQGKTILRFLESYDKEHFLKQVDKLFFLTAYEVEEQWVSCGMPKGAEFVDMEISETHRDRFPENSRDTGAEILGLINETEGKLGVINQSAFAKDGLFCEYHYMINFDENTLTVFTDTNKALKSFNLSHLPKEEDFIRDPRDRE